MPQVFAHADTSCVSIHDLDRTGPSVSKSQSPTQWLSLHHAPSCPISGHLWSHGEWVYQVLWYPSHSPILWAASWLQSRPGYLDTKVPYPEIPSLRPHHDPIMLVLSLYSKVSTDIGRKLDSSPQLPSRNFNKEWEYMMLLHSSRHKRSPTIPAKNG